MSGPGDEVTFLKKTHQLLDDGRMVIHIHPKHLDQLCKLLHLLKRLQNKRSPGHSEIETPDSTEELKPHDASVYRSCAGIPLYLSPDLPQCQYVIRYLSTCASQLGSDDPGRIFRHFPQNSVSNSGRNSQLRVFIGALSLLTLQLQGCVKRSDGHTVCVHCNMGWTSWHIPFLDVPVLQEQHGHKR